MYWMFYSSQVKLKTLYCSPGKRQTLVGIRLFASMYCDRYYFGGTLLGDVHGDAHLLARMNNFFVSKQCNRTSSFVRAGASWQGLGMFWMEETGER